MPRKTKGGRNWEKARKRVARMLEKVTNQRKDWIHKTTSHLVKQYDVLCIEDLKIRNMIQNHLHSTQYIQKQQIKNMFLKHQGNMLLM